MKGTGDGLSKMVELDPTPFKRGAKTYLLVETTVDDVHFAAADKEEPGGDAIRVHDFKGETITAVDPDLAIPLINIQKERNATADADAKAKAGGTDSMLGEHWLGQHRERKAGCADCEEEHRLENEERAAAGEPLLPPLVKPVTPPKPAAKPTAKKAPAKRTPAKKSAAKRAPAKKR